MRRGYHKWYSPNLGRAMELLVYGTGGARVLVFPTRGGRFYDYEEWRMADALQQHIQQGWLQLFCVDSVDYESLYCRTIHPRERMLRHLRYEQYILKEVLPFTRRLNPQPFMIAHGCSLGAYHALNLALRHPQLFGKVVALSGRYDLTQPAGPFRDLFDHYYDETIYFHTPAHFLPNLTDEHLLGLIRRMEIILFIGEEDYFYQNNLTLSQVMHAKDIQHTLHVWPGEAHNAFWWRQIVPWCL